MEKWRITTSGGMTIKGNKELKTWAQQRMKLGDQERSNYEINTAKSKDQTFLGKVCLHEFKNALF